MNVRHPMGVLHSFSIKNIFLVSILSKKKKKKNLVQNECNRPIGRLRSVVGRVAWWLATCARKPKVPGSSPAASYVQR